MRWLICTLTATVWLGIFTAHAQVDSLPQRKINVFSLEECVQYALQH
jgi:hypothetical protein